MCNFISWIEYDGKNYYLAAADLATKEGRELLKVVAPEDVPGHGAIRHYYPELKNLGTNKECEDFSSPNNFPKDIQESIKNGEFAGMGTCPDILAPKALAEYEKIQGPAWSEYKKIQRVAIKRRNKGLAFAEYKKIQGPAFAEYNKIQGRAFWKLAKNPKNRKEAWR